jgi:hypothetical protein
MAEKSFIIFLSFSYWWVCLWYFKSVKEFIRMCQKDEGCFCVGLKTLGDILMNFKNWSEIKFIKKSLLVYLGASNLRPRNIFVWPELDSEFKGLSLFWQFFSVFAENGKTRKLFDWSRK